MLSGLLKKLCPLMTLTLVCSCGKKINEPETSDLSRNRTGQNQELPAILALQIDENTSPVRVYELPRNAWFKLPGSLKGYGSSSSGKQVKIFYNLLPSGDYEFHCHYQSSVNGSDFSFRNCESSQGVEIISNNEDLQLMDFPMDKDSSIKLQLINGSGSGIKIQSMYLVDWK